MKCKHKVVKLGYLRAHADARSRLSKGEKQVRCVSFGYGRVIMTDKEITEKLALFMGYKYYWSKQPVCHARHGKFLVNKTKITEKYAYTIWNPLENISDAWELVEKMESDGYVLTLVYDERGCLVTFYKDDNMLGEEADGVDKSAPRAICMAALKVIENGDESHYD